MIIIGIVLLVLGLIVFILALRGRVAHQGQFCKKCKFDLAGLDLESSAAKCPECGHEIHQESARRTQIRRTSRTGVVIAVILILVGTSGIIAGAAGKTNAIIAAMPDRIVLWLTDWGVDKALDELHTRTSAVPTIMSEANWDRAIELGLEFQGDELLAWDIRWGQVLFDALNFNQMSNEEIEQYFTSGIHHELAVRDRVHPRTNVLPNRLQRIVRRIEPISGGITEFVMRSQITAVEPSDEEPIHTGELSSFRRPLSIYNHGAMTSSSAGTHGFKELFDKAPGEKIEINYEYTVRLDRGDRIVFEKHFSETISVSIIDPSEPIVRVVKDEELAQRLGDLLTIGSIEITEAYPELIKNGKMVGSNSLLVLMGVLPRTISLQAFLILDGEEYLIGGLNNNAHTGPGGIGTMVQVGVSKSSGSPISEEQAREIHAKLLGLDTVRIELRTNPEKMVGKPDVNEVLGITIVFEDVPINIVETLAIPPNFSMSNNTVKPTYIESYGEAP